MSIDLSQLVIEHVIIHEIMRQNLRLEKRPPIYSEIESSLDDDMKRYIKDKIVNSVGSTNSEEVVFRGDASSPVPEYIRNLLSEETPNLVQHSKAIADYLNKIQSGRSPGGLVTIVLGNVNNNRVVGVLKLEKEEGARLKQIHRDGLPTYDILHLKDIILSEKTRLFKIGLFFGDEFESINLDGIVCDNQLSYVPDREVADFFLSFLGCKLMGDPKVETKEFFVHSQGFFNDEVRNPIKQTEYNIHLVSYVTRQAGTLNPRTFASTNLDTDHRKPYIDFLTNKGVKIGDIRKDLTLIENRIKKVMIYFESGIKILGAREVFEDKVKLEQMEDGRDCFTDINGIIISTKLDENSASNILEPYGVKILKQEFDKEFTVMTLKTLVPLFGEIRASEFESMIKEFVDKNSEKISLILKERKEEVSSFPFLSQPELIVIFLLIDTEPFKLKEAWERSFPIRDLEKLSTWWGKPIHDLVQE